MKTFLKYFFGLIFFLSLIGVSLKLFAPDLVDGLLKKITTGRTKMIENHELSITYPEDLSSFDPTSYSTVDRSRLLNIYEGLVGIDKNLSTVPVLAKSFGSIDNLTWEFTLRDSVLFHNGSYFDMEDVLKSFEKARDKNSQLNNLLSNISDIRKTSDKVLQIKTKLPDPLLPNKIATVLIFPSEKGDEILKTPIGTGTYKFVSYDKGKLMKLEAFDKYWGNLPRYKYVTINTVPLKEERFTQLKEGRTDVLGAVPMEYVKNIQGKNKVIQKPSLEINFLFFNLKKEDGNIFANKKIRSAFSYALDKKEIVDFMGGYADTANQFVSKGVFGYTKDIKEIPYDSKKAGSLIKEVEKFLRLKGKLDLVEGPEIFGDYIQRKLFTLGVDVELNYLKASDFEKKIQEGKSNFYFLGWRSEFGDVSDFFASVIHSKEGKYGRYNGTNYKDEKLDKMIEESEAIIEPEKRLIKLNEIMKKIVEEDILGIPLFETQVLYGVKEGINWTPRMDGYILANEIN